MNEVEPKEVPLTLLEVVEWAQHPSDVCAGQPVIPYSNFVELSKDVVAYDEVVLTQMEAMDLFTEQTKRFSACGANHADDRFGVLRKNPKTGWQYIVDLLTGNAKEPE